MPSKARLPFAVSVLTSLVVVCCEIGCDGCPDRVPTVEENRRASAPPLCHPLDVDAGGAGEADGGHRATALFVITELRFGTEDQGLDMDCVDAPEGCESELCREGPPDGEGGVDNRLGPLARRISTIAGSDLQAEMSEAVESGRHPLLLEIRGATGLRDGRAEAVDITFGLDADDDPTDLPTGRGIVKRDPNAPSERPSRFTPVVIRDGVISAGPTTDWMPLFWTRGEIDAVPVVKAYLRCELSEEGHLQGLMAGAMSPGDLSRSIVDMDARTAKVLTRLGPVVRALVRGQSDLDLIPPGQTSRSCRDDAECLVGQRCMSDRCDEPEQHLDAISFAITFRAVPATESP